MRSLRAAGFLAVLTVAVSAAWGQLGLYGAPEMLEFRRPSALVAYHDAVPAHAITDMSSATQPAPPVAVADPPTAKSPESVIPSPMLPHAVPPRPAPQTQGALPPQTMAQQPAPWRPAGVTRHPEGVAPSPSAYRPAPVRRSAPPQPLMTHGKRTPTAGTSLRATPTTSQVRRMWPVPSRVARPTPMSDIPVESPGNISDMFTESAGRTVDHAGTKAKSPRPLARTVSNFESFITAPFVDSSDEPDGCMEEACSGSQFIRACESPWYASANALVMGRNRTNALATSFPTGNPTVLLADSQDVGLAWQWGSEVRIGRRFHRSPWALEATYWTLLPFDGLIEVTGADSLLDVSALQFGPFSATAWFNNATAHRLSRRDEVQSIELSLLRSPQGSVPCGSWNIGWSFGVRYFKFDESFTFAALSNAAAAWGQNPAQEAYLSDQIRNSLFGFQVGVDAGRRIDNRCRLYIVPKLGVYNNRLEHQFRAYLGDGTIATAADGTYPVRSTEDAVSLLTQIDAGLDCTLNPNWTLRFGYRVLAATGIALADEQIPHNFAVGVSDLQSIDHSSSLFLHGAYLGLTCDF